MAASGGMILLVIRRNAQVARSAAREALGLGNTFFSASEWRTTLFHLEEQGTHGDQDAGSSVSRVKSTSAIGSPTRAFRTANFFLNSSRVAGDISHGCGASREAVVAVVERLAAA